MALSSASAALVVNEVETSPLKNKHAQLIYYTDLIGAYDLVPGLTYNEYQKADQNRDGLLSADEFKKLVF